MRSTLRAGLLLLFCIAGCNRGPQATHRGLYLGGTANVFSSCGDSGVYWVQASAAITKILNVGGHMIGGAGRPIYVELRAQVLPARAQAEYAGTLAVDTVLSVSARRPASCGLPKGGTKLFDPQEEP